MRDKPCFHEITWPRESVDLLLIRLQYGSNLSYSSSHNGKNSPLVTAENNAALILTLRRFYTRRNVSGMSRRHCFFCSSTCVKVLLTNAFLKCRFRLKVEIISTFPPRTNVAFFLNQSFLCIHVSKASHYNMIVYKKVKWLHASTWKTVKYQKGF